MNDTMNLDIALEFLDTGKYVDPVEFMIESTQSELDNFGYLTESMNPEIINEKFDIKAAVAKGIEAVKKFFAKIISIIKGFIKKLGDFARTVINKIRSKIPKLSKEEFDVLDDIEFDDDFYDDLEDIDFDDDDFDDFEESASVINEGEYEDWKKEIKRIKHVIADHNKICLPLLTKEINLDRLSKIESFINDIEINKNASTDAAQHGHVALAIEKDDKGKVKSTTISSSICHGKLNTIIFDNSKILYDGDTPKESIDNYCKRKENFKAHRLNDAKTLFILCEKIIKVDETKSLVDTLNKLNSYMGRLEKVMESKFNFIQKKMADYYDEKKPTNEEGNRVNYTLLQCFRDTASLINSDIRVLNSIIEASMQKSKDAAAICMTLGAIAVKNKDNK